MAGENPPGAGNQQERPGIEQWIVGFVDGGGCFSCPIQRNGRVRHGWQLQPAFVIVQGERSVHVLESIRDYFGCGRIYRTPRHEAHQEDLFVYQVFRLADLLDTIIPFFEANPLRTAKADEFEKFATIVRMMPMSLHLSVDGLVEIAKIAQTMNHSEAVSIPGIPRGHTPANSPSTGELKIWSFPHGDMRT